MTNGKKRNIVLISVDSLRADHCGFLGYEKETTPNLSKIAEDSVVFENAIAPAPFTEQSMPAIFTGDYNMQTDSDTIREHTTKRRFIPEMLSKRGYQTAGFSPNPFTSRNFGFSRGFDEFHDFFGNETRREIAKTFLSRISEADFIEAIRIGANMAGLNIPGIGNQSIPFRAYEDLVLDWVSNTEEPFFLWIFLLEVHSPYRPTSEYRTVSLPRMLYLNLVRSHLVNRDPTSAESQELLDLYNGSIEHVDNIITTLMEDLSRYDPVFVIHSDHGELFGEHDNFGHNEFLYEENIHVPLLIANAGESGRISEPISLRQLPNIITSIAEDGNFVPEEFIDETVISRVGHQKLSLRGQDWKYLLTREGESGFYSIKSDSEDTKPDSNFNPSMDVLEPVTSHINTEFEKARISRAVNTLEVED